MSKIFVFIAVVSVILVARPCFGQSDISKQFESLQVNSSPAYTVLGVEPENIQRPNSPQEFVAIAQSATANGKVVPNFAIETTPYFWGRAIADSASFDAV